MSPGLPWSSPEQEQTTDMKKELQFWDCISGRNNPVEIEHKWLLLDHLETNSVHKFLLFDDTYVGLGGTLTQSHFTKL